MQSMLGLVVLVEHLVKITVFKAALLLFLRLFLSVAAMVQHQALLVQ
jgi:hypothetical protein